MKKKLIAIITMLSVVLALLVGIVIYMEMANAADNPNNTGFPSEGQSEAPSVTTDLVPKQDGTTAPTENEIDEPANETAMPDIEDVSKTTEPSEDETTETTETVGAPTENTTPEVTFPENTIQDTPLATDPTEGTAFDSGENATPELEF